MSAERNFRLDPQEAQPERVAIPLIPGDSQRGTQQVTQYIYQTINPLSSWRVSSGLKLVLIEICTLFENGKDKYRRNRFEYSKTNKEMGADLGMYYMTVSKRVTILIGMGLLLVKHLPKEGNRRLLTPAPVLRNAYLYSDQVPLYQMLFPLDEEPEELVEEANPSELDPLTQTEHAPAEPTRRARNGRAPRTESGVPPLMNVHVGTPEPSSDAPEARRAAPVAPSRTDYKRKTARVKADPPGAKPYEFPQTLDTPELRALWEKWGQCSKQKRRTHATRQQELTEVLSRFPAAYVQARLETAITGNHTAAWYPTGGPEDFEKWAKRNGHGPSGQSRVDAAINLIHQAHNPEDYDSHGNSLNRPDF